MSTIKMEPGTIVAKGNDPNSLAIIDSQYSHEHVVVLNPVGSLEIVKESELHSFLASEYDAVLLMYCCVALSIKFDGDIRIDLIKSIGSNFQSLNIRKAFFAKNILIANDYNPNLTHRILAHLYKKSILLCKEIIFQEEKNRKAILEKKIADYDDKIKEESNEDNIKHLENIITSLNNNKDTIENNNGNYIDKYGDHMLVPEQTYPVRDQEEALSKNRGHLVPGYVPQMKKRDFYYGMFNTKNGDIIQTKTYEETGYNTFEMKTIWKKADLDKLYAGEYGLFTIYDDGKTYISWPETRNETIYPSIYRKLKKQFEVNGEPSEIYVINEYQKGTPLSCIRADA